MPIHKGACHCGTVRVEVEAPARIEALRCNCSICAMDGFLHLIVPASAFRLLAGEDALTEYRFNTGVARHLFCRHCGIKPFYIPRSNPDGVSVNVNCLDRSTFEAITEVPFDGRDWEAAGASLAHLSKD